MYNSEARGGQVGGAQHVKYNNQLKRNCDGWFEEKKNNENNEKNNTGVMHMVFLENSTQLASSNYHQGDLDNVPQRENSDLGARRCKNERIGLWQIRSANRTQVAFSPFRAFSCPHVLPNFLEIQLNFSQVRETVKNNNNKSLKK